MRISASDYRDWARLFAKILVLIVILWTIFGVCFGLCRMKGVAMGDRIEDGDLVLISRFSSDFSSDDAILFRHGDKEYISRIVGFPGDVIDIDDQGCMSINEVRVSDDVVFDAERGEELNFRLPYHVPQDSYFVLNENFDALEDSRSFGAIPMRDIKGKAISILRTREV